MVMSRIEDFSIAVPQSAFDDLRDRLRHTRWPEAETVDDWSQGVQRLHAAAVRGVVGGLRLA